MMAYFSQVITASEVFVLVDMPSDSVRDREALQRYAVVVKKRMVERLTEHLNSYSSSNSDASSSRMTLLQRMLFQVCCRSPLPACS